MRKLYFLLISLIFAQTAFAGVSVSNGFDFPVGKPDGLGYTNGSNLSDNDGYGFL